MDQQLNTRPEAPSPVSSNRNHNKFYVIIGVCILAVIIVTLGFMLFNHNSSPKKPATGPTLTVGSHPYIYACNALGRDDIKKAGGELRGDKAGEAVTATQAVPYDQTPGGRYDLAKTIEDSLLEGVVTSKCDFIIGEPDSFEQKRVGVTVSQYPNSDTAENNFKTRLTTTKGAPFSSFKDTSFVDAGDPSGDGSVTAVILLDNSVVELKYGLNNVTAANANTKLDGLAQTIVKNLSDLTIATKPHDFSNLGTIGTTKLIDACHAADFKKADEILGGVHYEQTRVTNNYKYGKASSTSPGISAQCSVDFRYSADDSKQPEYKKQRFAQIQTRFPNQFIVSVASYPSAADATNAVIGLKKLKSDTAVDFTYGETSFVYTQTDTSSDFPVTAHHFVTVNGGSVITVSVSQGEVSSPYTSTVKTITTDQAKQLLDSLHLNK
jgi:hypothetical protein